MKSKHGTRVHSLYHLELELQPQSVSRDSSHRVLVESHDWQGCKPVNEPQLRCQMHPENIEFGTGCDALVVEVRSALLELFDERVGILQ